MTGQTLEDFVNDAVERREISRADAHRLELAVVPHGLWSRDQADLLIALDRAVPEKDSAWAAFLIRAVVDYVVWASRPTGYIDHETATWLVASLSCGRGPTPVGIAIAFEVVREAERSDEHLVAFAMRWSGGLHHEALMEAASCALL